MNDNLIFLDLESYSETPIRNGTHAYCEDAEIMVLSWAFGFDQPAEVHDLTVDPVIPTVLKIALADPSIIVVGHNFGNFDRTALAKGRLPDGSPCALRIPVERIHDTMVQALSHGLPGSLDKLGEIFAVSESDAKIKEGRELIQLLCKPRPKNQVLRRATRHTHPAEWKRFLEYAKSDITAMRHIYRHMPRWNYPGETVGNRQSQEYRLWCLDQKINDRGILMDTELARHAIDAVNKAQKNLNDKVDDMTFGEVERASQRDRLLKHLLSYYDVDLPDMSKATLEKRVADPDLPEPVRELIAIRLESAQTANSKYNALLKGVSDDDRLRGTLQFCGASRTGRWAGRVFQPQNLPRPKMKADQIEQEIAVIKMGASDTLLWRSPISAASDAIRGTIIAPAGRKLVVADLSNIEGRTLAWLAGEQWKLQAFRDYDAGVGPDLYLLTAGGILGVRPDEVSKDQRQSYGKTSELACGYAGAVGAFQTMATMFGLSFTDDKAWEIVRGWRAKNPNIVKTWEAYQSAAWNAVTLGGDHAAGKIVFEKWKNWLKIHLPSGRVLSYAAPSIIEDPRKAGRMVISYMGLNSYTRKWQRLTTYGGKLCIAEGTPVLTLGGWKPIETVTKNDLVWDGDAWVPTDGRIDNGVTEVIKAHGGLMTSDHEILTTEGWKRASQSEGYNRADCRIPDGYGVPGVRWQEKHMGGYVCLWGGGHHASFRTDEAKETRHRGVLRVQETRDDRQAQHPSRDERPPRICGLQVHDRPMPVADASGMAQLWRARHQGVRPLARLLRELLGGYVGGLRAWIDARSSGQRGSLHPGELSLDDMHRSEPQPAGQRARGSGNCSGVRGQNRHPAIDGLLPAKQRVFDLMNCGPRNRFVISTEQGPLIVHNCENINQAVARDVIAHGLELADDADFSPVLTVHDEIICETLDTPNYSVDRLAAFLSRVPDWADDSLPLSAAGFEGYRYRKE